MAFLVDELVNDQYATFEHSYNDVTPYYICMDAITERDRLCAHQPKWRQHNGQGNINMRTYDGVRSGITILNVQNVEHDGQRLKTQ